MIKLATPKDYFRLHMNGHQAKLSIDAGLRRYYDSLNRMDNGNAPKDPCAEVAGASGETVMFVFEERPIVHPFGNYKGTSRNRDVGPYEVRASMSLDDRKSNLIIRNTDIGMKDPHTGRILDPLPDDTIFILANTCVLRAKDFPKEASQDDRVKFGWLSRSVVLVGWIYLVDAKKVGRRFAFDRSRDADAIRVMKNQMYSLDCLPKFAGTLAGTKS